MAFTVDEIWEGRNGDIDNKGTRTYTRVFRVVTDSNLDGPREVRQATGIPRVNDPYIVSTEQDLGATVTSVKPSQQSEHPRVWLVSVEYSTDTGTSSQQEAEEDPLDRPAVIEWTFARFQIPAEFDTDGGAILNSAKERFDPPPMIDDSRPVLRITKNQSSFDPALAVSFQDAVNSDAFFGGNPGQVKVMAISSRNAFDAGTQFFEVQYEFMMRREGWALRVLDQGFKELIGGEQIHMSEPIMDAAPTPNPKGTVKITSPALLDGSGRKLDPPTATPHFLDYDVYQTKTFATLNLP